MSAIWILIVSAISIVVAVVCWHFAEPTPYFRAFLYGGILCAAIGIFFLGTMFGIYLYSPASAEAVKPILLLADGMTTFGGVFSGLLATSRLL